MEQLHIRSQRIHTDLASDMMIIAQRQLCGAYGIAKPGDRIDVSSEDARLLIRAGLATLYYETKVVVPEVLAPVATPFRLSDMPDGEQAGLAGASNPLLPVADVPEHGVIDSRRRSPGTSERKRSGRKDTVLSTSESAQDAPRREAKLAVLSGQGRLDNPLGR